MTIRYLAVCRLEKVGLATYYKIIIPSIAHAKEGFWVDERFQFTAGSECRYWVPPSSVLYVKKIEEPDRI